MAVAFSAVDQTCSRTHLEPHERVTLLCGERLFTLDATSFLCLIGSLGLELRSPSPYSGTSFATVRSIGFCTAAVLS